MGYDGRRDSLYSKSQLNKIKFCFLRILFVLLDMIRIRLVMNMEKEKQKTTQNKEWIHQHLGIRDGQRFLLYTIIVGDGESIYINSFVYFSIIFILGITVYILTNNKNR